MAEDRVLTMEERAKRAYIRHILIIAGIIIGAGIILSILFIQFKKYSDARLALREAKNIKMNLEMVDKELYAMGLSIYDDTAEGNLNSSALASVIRHQGELEGEIKLTGYNFSERKITGLEYELEKYIIRYEYNSDGESWHVCYIKEILKY